MNINNNYRYILRYIICPTHHPVDRIEELAEFCRDAKVEEVMFLFTAEELTTGHPTIEELGPWIEVAKEAKARLAENGVTVSLNPWTTTFHVARGRRLKPGQDFTLMVGETGSEAIITACPLCENWQNYLCETFAYMCREIQPTVLWVEDDWRLHNHEADMKFGGCFCALHLKRFAEMVGRDAVTREELLDAILAPGQPHPWRDKWFELWRDTLVEPAAKLRNVIQGVSPNTRLALMSSNPDRHSIEGRDWYMLQDFLGMEPEFLTRPNLPPYTEVTALQCGPDVTRQTIANLKRPLGIYPELENSPRCGIYSKSKTYTIMEMLESVCYGSHGITINHFDMMGNGISLDSEFAAAISPPKAMLNAVRSLGIDDNNSQGAAVLFSPEIAANMKLNINSEKEMYSLQNQSMHWARTLATLGIAHGFVKKTVDDRPVFVNDQTLHAFGDSDIEKLLGGVLICDGESVEILIHRGFGHYLGIESVQWKTLNEVGYGYEEIVDGQASIYGIENPRMTASRCSDKILAMQSADNADIRTLIKTGTHKTVAPGLVVHKNSLGGTVVSTAYPLGRLQFYMGYFNIFRQKLLQEVLFELSPNTKLAASVDFPLRVYRAKIDGGEFIGLINPTLDTRTRPTLRLSDFNENYDIKILSNEGQWRNCDVEITRNAEITEIKIGTIIEPLKTVYLTCK